MARKNKISAFSVIVGILLGFYVFSILFLFLWALLNSLKTAEEFDFGTLSFPGSLNFNNYIVAFFQGFSKQVASGETMRYVYIEEMFLYSILYAGGGALCQVTATCIAAYLTAKYRNVFSRFMHGVIIITMILPIVGALPSQIQIFDALGLRGSFLGVYVMKFGFTNIYYLIFYGAFRSMPDGYAEAARIDGANHFQVFFRIMLPLVSTLCGVVFLIFFIEYWNDYQTPMIFLDNNPVLAWGLYEFFKSYDQALSTPTVKIAGGIIVLLPLLVLFLVFKKKLMGNLTEGGIKS